MIFSSINHESLTADPAPYAGATGERWTLDEALAAWNKSEDRSKWRWVSKHYAPRPAFAKAPTNPHNPILAFYRNEFDEPTREWMRRGSFLSCPFVPSADQMDHARKVLTRLANLSKES